MIEIKQLCKHYPSSQGPRKVLLNLNLSIPPASIYGIIGQSGAGKSTLVRCMNLLEKPSSGDISIDRVAIGSLDAEALQQQRRHIGMVFQHFNLLSSKTVFDNIALPLVFMGLSKHAIKARVWPLLELTGLAAHELAFPAQLSGGQKQRVAIARALVGEPKVLLCDEPTSALDPETTDVILQLLSDINRKMSLTVVIITHDMHVLKTIAHHVAVLDDGCIVEQGPVLPMMSQPKHPSTRRLMDAAMGMRLTDGMRDLCARQRPSQQHPVLRFGFVGTDTATPFLSEMSLRWQIKFNILQAHIELVNHQPVGFMTVQALIGDAQLQQVTAHAQQHGFHVEVLSHAH